MIPPVLHAFPPRHHDLAGGIQITGRHHVAVGAVRRAGHHGLLAAQSGNVQLGVKEAVAVHQGHLQLTAGHRLGAIVACATQGLHPQGHRQLPVEKAAVRRRKNVLVGGKHRADPQIFPCGRLRHALRLVQQRLPAVGQRQEPLPRLGQFGMADALAPVEKLRAHLRFQRLDAVGQRGLGDEQRFRGGGQRAVLQHRPEGLHIRVVHGGASPQNINLVYIIWGFYPFYKNEIL